jgi:hypothetical protein
MRPLCTRSWRAAATLGESERTDPSPPSPHLQLHPPIVTPHLSKLYCDDRSKVQCRAVRALHGCSAQPTRYGCARQFAPCLTRPLELKRRSFFKVTGEQHSLPHHPLHLPTTHGLRLVEGRVARRHPGMACPCTRVPPYVPAWSPQKR